MPTVPSLTGLRCKRQKENIKRSNFHLIFVTLLSDQNITFDQVYEGINDDGDVVMAGDAFGFQ